MRVIFKPITKWFCKLFLDPANVQSDLRLLSFGYVVRAVSLLWGLIIYHIMKTSKGPRPAKRGHWAYVIRAVVLKRMLSVDVVHPRCSAHYVGKTILFAIKTPSWSKVTFKSSPYFESDTSEICFQDVFSCVCLKLSPVWLHNYFQHLILYARTEDPTTLCRCRYWSGTMLCKWP